MENLDDNCENSWYFEGVIDNLTHIDSRQGNNHDVKNNLIHFATLDFH